MPIELRMPQFTDSVSAATLVMWLKHEGETVKAGEAIAEIEADKSIIDLEAPTDGTLERIVVPEGTDNVPIGALLAVLVERDSAETPDKLQETGERPYAESAAAGPRPDPLDVPPPSTRSAASATTPVAVAATPLAASLAAQAGLDLSRLTGTGPGGQVTKRDVEAALASHVERTDAPAPAAPRDAPLPAVVTMAARLVPHSTMRRAIAERMTESKQTVPHFYVETTSTLDTLLALRAQLNARRDAARLTLTDFIVRAAALALSHVPALNVTWTDAGLLRHESADIAVAVATDRGLVAPVIRDAAGKSLATISAELRGLAERARAGQLAPADYAGGTFAISNLGMHGVDRLVPIINPPHAAILGVGAAARRPVVHDNEVVAATTMSLTLAADHRVLDGATAAEFLIALTSLLHEPLAILL